MPQEIRKTGRFGPPARRVRMRDAGDAMGVFTTREAAEEFIAGDPFVVNGVVASWTVRPWNEVLYEGP